jgi:hypothetical protein
MRTVSKPTKKTTKKVVKPATKQTTKTSGDGPNKSTASTYVPISRNIYYDGRSYRVRVSVNGVRYSQNFTSKKKAMDFRRGLLSGR